VQIEGAPSVPGQQFLGKPLALGPATGVQKAVGEGVGDEASHGAFQAEFAGALVALPGFLLDVALPADQFEREGNGQVGADDGLGIV
jgi:hypothetical protein